MLHTLVEYAEQHGIRGEAGFSPKRVRWLLNFSPVGEYLGIIEQKEPESKPGVGREFPKVPHLKFSGDTPMRQFLVDTAQYTILFEQKPLEQEIWNAFLDHGVDIQSFRQGIQQLRQHPSQELAEELKRSFKSQFPKKHRNTHLLRDRFDKMENEIKLLHKHAYFLDLLRNAGKNDHFFEVVAEALSYEKTLNTIRHDLEQQSPKAKPSDNLTFAEISGNDSRIIVEQDTWHDWWRGYFPTLFKQREVVNPMRCLVSGRMCEPSQTHPKIKGLGGVVGGKEETTLIGFNLGAFRSYGLKQSSNAAVSAELSEQYAAALNELIARHSRLLIGTKVVHWYAGTDEVPDEYDPFHWLLEEIDDESIERDAQAKGRSLLGSIRSGNRVDLLSYRYYSMTLSGSSARVMVRDWIEGQFGELVVNIDSWFNDLSIVRRDGAGLAPRPKLLAVLGALEREQKDVPPPIVAKIWRVAVRNEPIPEFIMTQVLARIKVDIIKDEPLRTARMGLLKVYHIRKGDKDMQPYLNEGHPNPAYHCGRLMAVYADLQRAALGDVGAGVVQRYYAAASATPALILGRLSRGSQFHLNKLEGGLAYWYEQRLASIWGCIKDELPKTLTLEEQSLFALGYYQQKAARKSADEKPLSNNESKGD